MRVAIIVPGGNKVMAGMKEVARPPLGACYLKSFLEINGHTAKVFHQVDETNKDLVKRVKDYSPALAGLSVMSYVFEEGMKLARMLKQVSPNTKTVFGGEHITGCFVEDERYEPGFLVQNIKDEAIDFLIPFEGEFPLLNLANSLEGKISLSQANGFSLRTGQEWLYTGRASRIMDLDTIPPPDRSDLPYEKYRSVDEASDLEYMHTGRGCKFSCSYCATPVSNPGRVAACSANRVLDEIEERFNAGRRHFFFADELFTFDPKRLADVCKGIEERGMQGQIQYRIFARVDDVVKNRIDLKLLKKSGCNGLFFGVESMNADTLNRLRKGTNPEMIEGAFKTTYEAGIPIWGSLMLGFPWETESELRASLQRYANIAENKVFHTYSTFITPFPGTSFHNYCRKNNLILDPSYLRSDSSFPVLKTPIPCDRLVQIHSEFRHMLE